MPVSSTFRYTMGALVILSAPIFSPLTMGTGLCLMFSFYVFYLFHFYILYFSFVITEKWDPTFWYSFTVWLDPIYLCPIFMSIFYLHLLTCICFYSSCHIELSPHGSFTGIRCSQISQNGFSNFCQMLEIICAIFVDFLFVNTFVNFTIIIICLF